MNMEVRLENEYARTVKRADTPSLLTPTQLYKRHLAAKFSRAAQHYKTHALVQQDIARYLVKMEIERAECWQTEVDPRAIQGNRHWLDLGSGTGYLSQLLSQQTVQAVVPIRVDIALGMLKIDSEGIKINADAEALPIANHSIDTVVSSMALQWVSSPNRCAQELARVMKSGAKAYLAILRFDSLQELRQAWTDLGQTRRLNPFFATDIWRNAFLRAGLCIQSQIEKSFLTLHPSAVDVLHSIKDIGAGQTLTAHGKSIRRSDLRALDAWWQLNCDCEHGLPLTYKVDFWQLAK